MSEAPERIWMDPDIKFPECDKQYGSDIEYVRADRIEELEVKLAKVISLADAMAEAIEDQIDICDASMDEQAAVKNYRTTLAELTSSEAATKEGGKDE